MIYINTDISNFTKYNTFQDATSAYGHPAALAHITNNGVVTESYVAFERNNIVYYLKGRINESNESSKPVYEANVATLKEAFGPDWQSVCTDDTNYFNCSADGVNAYAYAGGTVSAIGDYWGCFVYYAGDANCYSL